MNDCDRIFVIMYVPISGGMERINDAFEHMYRYFDNTVKPLVVPTNENNPRVEVLNPRYVSKKEYKELVKKANKYLDNFINFKTEE